MCHLLILICFNGILNGGCTQNMECVLIALFYFDTSIINSLKYSVNHTLFNISCKYRLCHMVYINIE